MSNNYTQFGLFGNSKEVKPKRKRKRLPEDRGQMKMFRDSEVLQFGVKAKPLISLSEHMKLPMLYQAEHEETDDQKAQRMQRQAEERTRPLFEDHKKWNIVIKRTRKRIGPPFDTLQEAKESSLAAALRNNVFIPHYYKKF